MSRARHHTTEKKVHHEGKKRARGGALPEITGGDPDVLKEARVKKSVGVIEGERAKKRGDRMAVKRGGAPHCRASGGKVGADMHPWSSARGKGPVTAASREDEAHEGAHKRGGKVEHHHSGHHTHDGKKLHHHGHYEHHEDREHGGHVKKEAHRGR